MVQVVAGCVNELEKEDTSLAEVSGQRWARSIYDLSLPR